jgi:hypothetical protein
MRLLRLHVADFASIVSAELEFGRGLNILYGPNDLGKSTLADSIRVGLLLPHTSTHIESFVPWTGGQHPRVEITFETEAQRIWRVIKILGKSGSSVLQESRNGVDFEEAVRGRQVDARVREILRWGIPEPGGSGTTRGVPTSFLATALLSTQSNVGAILDGSLEGDSATNGRERIAAALQAVAQDPVFVSLLRRTQDRRDQAYTEKGAKKTSRDSPFKKAAERLNVLRQDREHWLRVVEESQSVEHHLRDLIATRSHLDERVATASEELATRERLMREGVALAFGAEQARQAQERVSRIQRIDTEIATGERILEELGRAKIAADEALADARRRKEQADTALEQALAAARPGNDPELADTVATQAVELRRSVAAKAAADAQQRIDAATAARRTVEAVDQIEREVREHIEAVASAAEAASHASESQQSIEAQRRRTELLECAVSVRAADERLAVAESLVARVETLRSRTESTAQECQALEGRRAILVVPPQGTLADIRRLSTDLAAARAALDVGLVVTVVPKGSLSVRVRKDGVSSDATLSGDTVVIEAHARVDLDIADIAAITVQGGRADAVARVRVLEQRWADEALPLLRAAGAADVEALDVKATEARELDSAIVTRQSELKSLEEQVAALGDSDDARQKALAEVQASRGSIGAEQLEPLLHELSGLGQDPGTVLRTRKESAAREFDRVQRHAASCQAAESVAEDRLRAAQSALQAAVLARDAALAAFPNGPAAALAEAQVALKAAVDGQEAAMADLSGLEAKIATEAARIGTAVVAARSEAGERHKAVQTAELLLQNAIGDQASQSGSIEQLRRLREMEDLESATEALRVSTERQSTLPIPGRAVTDSDVLAAANALDLAKAELLANDGEVHKAHGALEQVGGAVARERLQDVTDAYEAAERHERETEAEYEAWKLLLETMKAADADQASNLGQVLAPAVASRFETLTEKRYEGVKLTPQLATEGVIVRGAVRSADRMSVGTREQLSTLYRLALAEYLSTCVVLDDQLVQSDHTRMDWFRELLREKAQTFQIVVLTCRPSDYLSNTALTTDKGSVDDAVSSSLRATDLARAIQRR